MYIASANPSREVIGSILGLRMVLFDFDGVFTDNRVWTFEDGREAVSSSRFDGIGLRRLERSGVVPFVLSTEENPVVSARCRKLRIACVQGSADKGASLDRLLEEHGLTERQVGFLGNDVNDIPCLTRVGLPMVVSDAHPDVISYAMLRTNTPGGHGAVREVCDLIAKVRESHDI
ncbi:KdsC family phosphatase [Magnetospirillum fulvum]|uniref:3-deoxy-D-manno-octulosonate 8-phosphate phosphatase (KDO 8-P phosphatase) n=1 Tax=Magnetospirillum fulvum TaxID=1082 RepID=A0A1H6H7X3_MAGFU|nr:HAD hydrolase family protein [Magnetospirillum fulvum]SEH30073.1 3-deoxy-D-manno-octulosonate 8-phosphate phosphatase (KDO 8-P phosphatase) [Magnetospirillum fulvum]